MVVLVAALRSKGLRVRTVASLVPVSHKHSLVNQSLEANAEYWCEVFLSGRWVPASAVNGSVDNVQSMFAKIGTPKRRRSTSSSERKRSALHTHVVACERGRYYDVTPRYNKEWHKVQAHRAPDNFLGELLKRLSGPRPLESPDSASEADKVELEGIALSEPLPTSQAAYVNHPRFALEKHLLKFQILHPKEPVLGYCSGLPVYPRRCVHTLRSKERWIREMRKVRDEAEPVKLMSARKGSSREGQQIELFGFWQTEKYVPPFAFDGIVPKDENNKLDIWTPEHIPGGCVHVQMKYAAQMARRLQIDYAVAMTGFDIRPGGKSVPKFEGVVVLEENKELLEDAARAGMGMKIEADARKEYDQLVGLWRKVIRAVRAKEKVRRKYGGALEHDMTYLQSKRLGVEQKLLEPEAPSASVENRAHVHEYLPAVADRNKPWEFVETCKTCGLKHRFSKLC
mmetsp:Transcript_12685/g.51202  ORF Transcript_12685/g.51202 Transcript_12685/m.51202 type:complete len:455 (-) Transcript_12685:251-1615(-)